MIMKRVFVNHPIKFQGLNAVILFVIQEDQDKRAHGELLMMVRVPPIENSLLILLYCFVF